MSDLSVRYEGRVFSFAPPESGGPPLELTEEAERELYQRLAANPELGWAPDRDADDTAYTLLFTGDEPTARLLLFVEECLEGLEWEVAVARREPGAGG